MGDFQKLLINIKNKFNEENNKINKLKKDQQNIEKNIFNLNNSKLDKTIFKNKKEELANKIKRISMLIAFITLAVASIAQIISTNVYDVIMIRTIFAPLYLTDIMVGGLSLLTAFISSSIAKITITKKYGKEIAEIDEKNEIIDKEIENNRNKIELIKKDIVLSQTQIDQLVAMLFNEIEDKDNCLDVIEFKDDIKLKTLRKDD